MDHPTWAAHAQALGARASGRTLVVIDGGVSKALAEAGVAHKWLADVVPGLETSAGSCATEGERPLACCGAAGPLLEHHPEDARRVGELWLKRAEQWSVADARCRSHLRNCGGDVGDPLDALLARQAGAR
jgi:hypothetical protein